MTFCLEKALHIQLFSCQIKGNVYRLKNITYVGELPVYKTMYIIWLKLSH